MSSTDAYLKATLNRLTARLEQGIADAAASLAVLAQDAPSKLQQEWELFQQEVRAEADRLEQKAAGEEQGLSDQTSEMAKAQDQIDQLRAKVAVLSRQVEDLH